MTGVGCPQGTHRLFVKTHRLLRKRNRLLKIPGLGIFIFVFVS